MPGPCRAWYTPVGNLNFAIIATSDIPGILLTVVAHSSFVPALPPSPIQFDRATLCQDIFITHTLALEGTIPPMEHEASPSAATRPALPAELRAATREEHHALNTLIVPRLSLCLSPQVDSPLVYAKGMAAFGNVYFAFEDCLAAGRTSGRLDPRLGDMYEILHIPQLIRTNRLRGDIELIKSRLEEPAAREIAAVEDDSKVFYSRIHDLLSTKPHVMLGYTWAMYLALFNGGRWIRRQLASQGPEFWRGDQPPLSFWEFEDDGSADSEGEHVKVLFQERLLSAASLLRDDEKDEIVEETGRLFKLCSEIVHILDDTLAVGEQTTPRTPSRQSADPGVNGYLGHLSLTTPLTTAWQYLASSYASLRPTTK